MVPARNLVHKIIALAYMYFVLWRGGNLLTIHEAESSCVADTAQGLTLNYREKRNPTRHKNNQTQHFSVKRHLNV